MKFPNDARVTVRPATPTDVPQILQMIKELASYEELADRVVASESDLLETLFGPKIYAEVALAWIETEMVGQAIFFHNFSTFLGRPGLYLEDLFVRPEGRAKKVGLALMIYLAQLAVARNCYRIDWQVLDWNRQAIHFYDRLGAQTVDGWKSCRLDRAGIEQIARLQPFTE